MHYHYVLKGALSNLLQIPAQVVSLLLFTFHRHTRSLFLTRKRILPLSIHFIFNNRPKRGCQSLQRGCIQSDAQHKCCSAWQTYRSCSQQHRMLPYQCFLFATSLVLVMSCTLPFPIFKYTFGAYFQGWDYRLLYVVPRASLIVNCSS